MSLSKNSKICVIGSGTMGTGIAQIAATYGNEVTVIDKSLNALKKSEDKLNKIMTRLVEKGKIKEDESKSILSRIDFSEKISSVKGADLVVEAIVEDLLIKSELIDEIENHVSDDCIIASNTSSLSIASLTGNMKIKDRMIGLHFFNPAPLMKLVEVIPSFSTKESIIEDCVILMSNWGKVPVVAKDTPGFIVNRVARPFYGEALRIYEEGIADFATIDWAMRELGGFKMGPFELMDFIGNDVNYTVTETVFTQMYFDPKFKPSITQKRLVESGYYGKKSGHGFYDYSENANNLEPNKDRELGEKIFYRILTMLINEAADAVFFNIASVQGVDDAMTKGVNYPKGLLRWADELGIESILATMEILQDDFGEDRYRPSHLLRKMAKDNISFY